ncbi:glycosyltransferase family 2 protein [Neolentinus lepideus HHB14362 ss-1]|uniref:chitin synthase n=1 Tax=Neolentinus lepideus HHB14362 ss-1 TaxID=1314782 RepID=A0A165N3W5_9AGAM|nr:glycosyltransferase family 2 protein [Neolentinus lepideus HHB14362 ss-1]
MSFNTDSTPQRGSRYLDHERRPLESVSDLVTLISLSDNLIVSCLRERFMSDIIYTNIGSSAVIAVSPHKYVSSNADSVLQNYIAEYRDTSQSKIPLPPHVFQLATNAYYHMRRTTQDQCILLSGETGSGKSESRRLSIKILLELSINGPGKRGAKLVDQLPASEFILESFGNASTLQNSNASRFGKYTELQFTEKGRVCGAKTLDYYLERSRVARVPSGERNFHVFYYLLAGVSQEERQHLQLDEKVPYRYLGQSSAASSRNPMRRKDDGVRFEQLKMAMKNAGFSKRQVAQIFQLVAAIVHLGNLDFTVDRHRNEDAAVVRNVDLLGIVADFLGVRPPALEAALSYKTRLVRKELCTVFLDPDGASDNRDDLAKTLYSLLFTWLNEYVNKKLCRDDFATFIALLDLPGPQNMTSRPNSLDQFCINYANERLHHFMMKRIFENDVEEYQSEGLSDLIPQVPYYDNSECLRLIQTKPGGLIHIMDDQASRVPKKTDHTMAEAFGKRWANHGSFKPGAMDSYGFPTFTIQHYSGPVTYSTEGFLERNLDAVNPDFVSLLCGSHAGSGRNGGTDSTGSANPFIKGLFSSKSMAVQADPRGQGTIVAAQQPVKPMRAPSTRRKNVGNLRSGSLRETKDHDLEKDDLDSPSSGAACVAGEFRGALDTLFETLSEAQPWHILCINPNDSQLPNQFEGRAVKSQVKSLGLPEISQRLSYTFEVSVTMDEFVQRYRDPLDRLDIVEGEPRERVEQTRTTLDLRSKDIVIGHHKAYLSQAAFHRLEDYLRSTNDDEQKWNRSRDAEIDTGLRPGGTEDLYAPYLSEGPSPIEETSESPFRDPFGQSSQALRPPVLPYRNTEYGDEDSDERKSLRSDDFDGRSRLTSHQGYPASEIGTESYAPSRNMFQNGDTKALLGNDGPNAAIVDGETVEDLQETSARRRWVALCWLLTWWVPTPFLSWFGRMKRPDVRQAWREKLAINIIIWFICGCTLFVIIALGDLICPTEHVYSTSELASHNVKTNPNNVFTSIRGEVFDLTEIAAAHERAVSVVPAKSILNYGGTAADNIFPVQVSALCNGVTGNVSPYVVLDSSNDTDPNAQYHDFRAFTNDSRPDWYFEVMTEMRWNNRVGFVGYTPKEIRSMATSSKSVAIYNGLVYDLTSYINTPPYIKTPAGTQSPGGMDTQFMHPSVVDLFKTEAGGDITNQLNGLNIDSTVLQWQRTCLRNLFLVGKVDNRESAQCLFSTYILLSLSIIMVSVIGFKFIASINLSAVRAPEDHDKFVMCQVTCYTEGEQSLRKTIDSLARMKYDDKRKLLVILCDGMIVGSGNDRPTPRIVLDILGADPDQDPEPLSFLSLGEGAKQHNMGKVYSGLYETSGHVVPYLVLVKVGKPNERSRPGNRGKRDSQMLLMRFLNKIHFSSPMSPMELEMYHQIKNVIGVNPSFYEYLFMVDADTTVDPLSLNRLVSAMVRDKKLLGVCGETSLANAKQSLITMMQVYEYFISHHMTKAFESLFGSVTCLPGCFTLYRLRTADTKKPLLISNQMIQDYSQNRVDTLHMKNLLHLGEDRYLTTLLLKHFPFMKTQFVRDAHAYTVAPDDWKILLSQRRRWINSTVHNLGELVFLDQLCGFCCFSMRFVVLIDLVSTIIAPVTVAYIGYLIYLAVGKAQSITTVSIVMIAAVYGLQALVFVVRRKWDMVGWMVFYLLGIPAFSLFLPLYSFWKMDDFSWGQTRIVLGEQGKKLIVHDEGKFDPKSIPLKSWEEYENELWDNESNHSIGSWVPPSKLERPNYESRGPSLYGAETYYEPKADTPPVMTPFGPPSYRSGRNTPSHPMSEVRSLNEVRPMSQMRPMSEVSSVLHQPVPSRAVSSHLNFDLPSQLDMQAIVGSPSDAELERAVQNILKGADLNTITKREIRRRLEEQFGVDLTARKGVINAAIERELA